jgi:O-acetyl-ADP-ribose deacetylase (regulator of RNase III)
MPLARRRRRIVPVTMEQPGGRTSAGVIRACTAATLRRADELGCRTLALVAFGTGVGGFPLEEAAEIEVAEVRRHGETARSAFERAVLGSG